MHSSTAGWLLKWEMGRDQSLPRTSTWILSTERGSAGIGSISFECGTFQQLNGQAVRLQPTNNLLYNAFVNNRSISSKSSGCIRWLISWNLLPDRFSRSLNNFLSFETSPSEPSSSSESLPDKIKYSEKSRRLRRTEAYQVYAPGNLYEWASVPVNLAWYPRNFLGKISPVGVTMNGRTK